VERGIHWQTETGVAFRSNRRAGAGSYHSSTPAVFRACLGFGLFFRIAIALLLVAPLGFVLGMPFTLGLRVAMQRSSALGAWAWGVNGFFTVIG
jgi:hypothetical protein